MKSISAIETLKYFEEMGARLHHSNGAQWYIELTPNKVVVMDTSTRDNVTVDYFTEDKAVSYLESSGNCKDGEFKGLIQSVEDSILFNK